MGRKVASTADGKLHLIFCPACQCGHQFDQRWTYNGNPEKPTFRNSMLVYGWDEIHRKHAIENGYKIQERCHSYVTDGKIEYLADCTHSMVGQIVELPDI